MNQSSTRAPYFVVRVENKRLNDHVRLAVYREMDTVHILSVEKITVSARTCMVAITGGSKKDMEKVKSKIDARLPKGNVIGIKITEMNMNMSTEEVLKKIS